MRMTLVMLGQCTQSSGPAAGRARVRPFFAQAGFGNPDSVSPLRLDLSIQGSREPHVSSLLRLVIPNALALVGRTEAVEEGRSGKRMC